MINRREEFPDKQVRVQAFTNLQSIHTTSSIITDRKDENSYDKKSDQQTKIQKVYHREVIPQRFQQTEVQFQNYRFEQDNQFMQPTQLQNFGPVKKTFEDQKLDEEREFQSINLKKFKIEDFELGMKLGKGKFGNVYLAREKATNYIVALKILNKIEVQRLNGEKLIVREIKIHSYVDHPNIIKLYGFFHDDQNIYLILEYAPDGEVYKELKKSVD